MATIGVYGLIASGKDTVADYLVRQGFSHISLSALLREEAARAGVEDSRESLRVFATDLKRREGSGVLALRALEKRLPKMVITSIRHPGEVEILRAVPGFCLVAVEAPADIRYERAKIRLRAGDSLGSFDDFLAAEAKERTGTGGQVMDEVAKLVDYTLDNSCDRASLYRAIDEFLSRSID